MFFPLTVPATAALSPSWCTRSKPRFTFWRTKRYREKNEHLEKFLEPVEPYEFYREIFPEGSFERKGHFEDRKGNGIAVTVPKGEVDKATGIALQIEGDGKAALPHGYRRW